MRELLIINGIIIDPNATYYAQERYLGIEGRVIGVEGLNVVIGPARIIDSRQMLAVCMPYGSTDAIEKSEVARYEIPLQRFDYFKKK